MLIIAQEPSQATEKLRRLLDSFGIQSRVFYPNFETDFDENTISLASSFIYSSEEDYQGKPLFFNDLSVPLYWELWTLGITTYILMVKTVVPVSFFVKILKNVRSNKSNGLDKGKKSLR